jgi:hypothetical protein
MFEDFILLDFFDDQCDDMRWSSMYGKGFKGEYPKCCDCFEHALSFYFDQ